MNSLDGLACKNSYRIGVAFLLFGVGMGCVAKEPEPKRSAEAQKVANSLQEKIRSEIKQTGEHAWAGEYYAGDGLGRNTSLAIAPAAGFVFEGYGCLGLYDRNYGAVTWEKDRIRLAFTYENKRKGFQRIAPEFIPVMWGPRHYLIPADEMVEFCNSVNAGEEPRNGSYGFYLLRENDKGKKVTGLPGIPVEYRAYLLEHPVEATLLNVEKPGLRIGAKDIEAGERLVSLDVGATKGLFVGMKMFTIQPSDAGRTVEITKVEAQQAEGIMRFVEDGNGGPEKGWRFSTRAPWYDAIRKAIEQSAKTKPK